jgi:hypothetical protein
LLSALLHLHPFFRIAFSFAVFLITHAGTEFLAPFVCGKLIAAKLTDALIIRPVVRMLTVPPEIIAVATAELFPSAARTGINHIAAPFTSVHGFNCLPRFDAVPAAECL